jgi:hypothetical protein
MALCDGSWWGLGRGVTYFVLAYVGTVPLKFMNEGLQPVLQIRMFIPDPDFLQSIQSSASRRDWE